MKISARNVLKGKVTSIKHGPVSTETDDRFTRFSASPACHGGA